jgi:hypothetical protein
VNRFGCGGIKNLLTGTFSISPPQPPSLTFLHTPYRTVDLHGIIPGGNSFDIPQGSLSTNNITGTGFSWTVDINGGTDILLIAGDERGIGSAGVAPFTVAFSANSSCMSGTSPSSTAGSPVGGSYPTSTGASSSGGSGTHS